MTQQKLIYINYGSDINRNNKYNVDSHSHFFYQCYLKFNFLK